MVVAGEARPGCRGSMANAEVDEGFVGEQMSAERSAGVPQNADRPPLI